MELRLEKRDSIFICPRLLMKRAYQAALLELPFRIGLSAAARRCGRSCVRAGRQLADPLARRHRDPAASLRQLLSTAATRAEYVRRLVVPGLVPRHSPLAM